MNDDEKILLKQQSELDQLNAEIAAEYPLTDEQKLLWKAMLPEIVYGLGRIQRDTDLAARSIDNCYAGVMEHPAPTRDLLGAFAEIMKLDYRHGTIKEDCEALEMEVVAIIVSLAHYGLNKLSATLITTLEAKIKENNDEPK